MSNVAFKIEDGIEPPRRRSRYPFALLQPGQSVHIQTDDAQKVHSAAWQHGRRYGVTLQVWLEGNGVRVRRDS